MLSRKDLIYIIIIVFLFISSFVFSLGYFRLLRERSDSASLPKDNSNLYENELDLLSRELMVLQNKYSELTENYSFLQEKYMEALKIIDELSFNYSVLSLRYYEEAKLGAKEILKNLSKLVNTNSLWQYIGDFYLHYENMTEIVKPVSILADKQLVLAPGNYVYLIAEAKHSGRLLVQVDTDKDCCYDVLIMTLEDFASFLSGRPYKTMFVVSNSSQIDIDVDLAGLSMLVAVLINKGKDNLVVNSFSVSEVIGITAPQDLRKIYAVNYYIAKNVPYVPDVYDVAKPPLETINKGGDCEDRAILVASLLLTLGYNASRVALALVDSDGDRVIDHASVLAQVSSIKIPEEIYYHFEKLSLLFTGKDPLKDYRYPVPIFLIPSLFVNGSDGKGYFIVVDPFCICIGTADEEKKLLPGYLSCTNYNIVYAETIESLNS